jgi:hypothetical protein
MSSIQIITAMEENVKNGPAEPEEEEGLPDKAKK